MEATFGNQVSGASYRDREGAYAVAFDEDGKVALVEAPATDGRSVGLFLPGGGIEPGETPEACICRECLEETGRVALVGDYLCTGDEYLFAPSDQAYLHVIGRCYRVKLGKKIQEPVEQDHTLVWIPVQDCGKLFLQYQAWAVKLAWEKKEKEI